MTANQSISFDTGVFTTVTSGQAYSSAFIPTLAANNQFSFMAGSTLSYVLITNAPNGSGQVVSSGQVVTATEEDLADIVESDRAMAEARRVGTRSWRQVRKELGL
jgi:hypothetical protein